MINKSAIIITNMKFASVSKPSQFAKASNGFGKIAIIMKTRGRSSQAIEFLMDIVFLRRLKKMRMRRMRVAMDISIWILVMRSPFEA